MSKASGKYRELPASDEPAAAAADTPSRALLLRATVEQAEARAAAAREEAVQFDEEQQQHSGGKSIRDRQAERQPEPEPEPSSALTLELEPASQPNGEIEHSVQAEMAELRQQFAALTPVHRGSTPEASAPDTVSRQEHEVALAEVAKLRQVFHSAKAVADDEQGLLRVLATADDYPEERPDPEQDSVLGHGAGSNAPKVPSGHALRETLPTKGLHAMWFTPDAKTLVHGGCRDPELSFWDLCTGERIVGVKREGAVYISALSPDGRLLCIAAKDGLAMYSFVAGTAHAPPSCEQLWEVAPGNFFCDVAFSRDGTMVASVRGGELDALGTGVLEIRDAESNTMVKQIIDFPACDSWEDGLPHGLSFSHELLAVAGKQHKPNSRYVRLHSIASGFEELKKLEVPGAEANRCVNQLEFNTAGTRLAVGIAQWAPGNGPCAAIYSSENNWSDPPLHIGGIEPVDDRAHSLCWSHDGRLLCVGYRQSKSFGIWDLEAEVCVRVIKCPGTEGATCAFSPADDLLALGGIDESIVLCELLPSKPLETWAMPGKQMISAAVASDTLVVLASGKRLAALRRADRKVLWEKDAEEAIFAELCSMSLQPTGAQVAVCIGQLKLISVRDVETGDELYQLKDLSGMCGVKYSPDSAMIMVCMHPNGGSTKVFDAATGEERHSFEGKGGYDGGIDPSGKLLVMTGPKGANTLLSLESGQEVFAMDGDAEHTNGGVFNDAGDRMAYNPHDGVVPCSVALCEKVDDGTWREAQRWDISDKFQWAAQLHFSPGDGRYLLLVSRDDGDKAGHGHITFLDTETGKEPTWSQSFRAMMLPPGDLHHKNDNPGHGVRWVVPPASQLEAQPDSASSQHRAHELHNSSTIPGIREPDLPVLQPPLILQAAIDDQLYLIDVSAFIRSFEQDGNFSVEQLNCISDIQSEATCIPHLLKHSPHVINVRDKETGDTVLHHCARMAYATQADKNHSRGVAEQWLSSTAMWSPLQNDEGHTALHIAISNHRLNMTNAMIMKGLPSKRYCLTQDLVTIGELWTPAQLCTVIELMDDNGGFQKLRTLSALKQELDGLVVRASHDGSGEATWDLYEGGNVRCDSVVEVIALRGFAARPADGSLPPYTKLINNAAQGSEFQLSRLMKTKLMKVTTKFKWEKHVRARVVHRLFFYMAHLAIAAVALLVSSQTGLASPIDWSNLDWGAMNMAIVSDLLQGALLVTNSFMLWKEVHEVWLTLKEQNLMKTTGATCWTALWAALTEHLSAGWNLCDLAGIIALFVATAAHFTGSTVLLQQIGAVGVLLNAFSLLKLVQPLYKSMGTLIEVLTQTSTSPEVLGFGGVMVVLIWGFGAAFTVSMPHNEAFFTANRTVLPGLLTATMAMVGDFDVDQYEFGTPFVMFILFLYLVIIVMFNVLIAIVSELYIEVKISEDVEVYRRRAEAIVSAEARMSNTDKQDSAYFPEFLEVLRVEADGESVRHVKISQVQEDVAQLSAKVDQQSAEQSKKIESLGKKMAADVADLKALVAQLVVQQGQARPVPGLSSAVGNIMARNRGKQRSPLAQ